MKSLLVWAKGAASAFVSGAAGSVATMVIDPKTFNLHDGLTATGTVAAVTGVIALANYLVKSPLPKE